MVERHDAPDRAAEYHALQRAGSDDPYRSLSVAREEMRGMSLYSTIDDRVVERTSRPVDKELLLDDSTPGRLASPLNKWSFLGPGNIGGRTRVLVIDPVEPQIMYTGGVSGGIWKTTSGGAEWIPIGDDLANIAINSLVMHPTDRNTLYAGTGEGYFRELVRGTALPLRGDGIFVTHDAGETWTRLPATDSEDFHWVNDLAISRHDPSRLYAATRTGVWRSTDEGATWSRVLATNVMGGCLDLAQRTDTDGDTLFASCGTFERATVYRNASAEGDGEWEAVFSDPKMGRTTLAIAPSNQAIIYALAASNEPGKYDQGLLGVFRSEANGDAGTWNARLTNDAKEHQSLLLTNLIAAYGAICSGLSEQIVTMGWYCNTIAVDPVDPSTVWVGGVDLFRSDNGGLTFGVASYWWANSNNHASFVHADQHAIVFHPRYDGASNRSVYFTNDGGVFRTDNSRGPVAFGDRAPCKPDNSGMQFTSLNNSYGVTQFYHGAVSPNGKTFVAGAQDNGTLLGTIEDGPNAWRHILGGDGGYCVIDPQQPKYIYAESQVGNISRSNTGGTSFKNIRSTLNGQEFLFITPFTIDPNESKRLWIGGRYMWFNTDRGDTPWKVGSTALPALVSAVAVQPGNSDLVIAGTAGGHIVRNAAATSATQATQWSIVQPRQGFVSWVAFDPTNKNIVYATYAGFGGQHLWRSLDAGATWSAVENNLPDIPVHSIAIDPTRGNRLYLGTDLGVFVSLDNGTTWSVENTGFANAVTETVLIAQGENGPAIYAFTHGRGAWRADLVQIPVGKRRSARH